jgi:hypothetical protein
VAFEGNPLEDVTLRISRCMSRKGHPGHGLYAAVARQGCARAVDKYPATRCSVSCRPMVSICSCRLIILAHCQDSPSPALISGRPSS